MRTAHFVDPRSFPRIGGTNMPRVAYTVEDSIRQHTNDKGSADQLRNFPCGCLFGHSFIAPVN